MDVVRRTFQALLPRMLQAVETADFVAIDTELTGTPTCCNSVLWPYVTGLTLLAE